MNALTNLKTKLKSLKLKNYGKWNLGAAALNLGVGIVCWNPFAIINLALAAFLTYDAFEKKPEQGSTNG